MNGKNLVKMLGIAVLAAPLLFATGCGKKRNIRDVDPSRAGDVRSLGPESQDVIAVADQMLRSLSGDPVFQRLDQPPTIVMLPMENNTRHAFNQEIFTSLLKAQLNRTANGRMSFVSRDLSGDIATEREMKREGDVDYNPDLMANAPLGADFFLKGRADGLSNVSTEGQAETILYTFKLVDAETGLEVWEDLFTTKKEGRDDLLYR